MAPSGPDPDPREHEPAGATSVPDASGCPDGSAPASAEARYRALVEASGHVVWRAGSDGRSEPMRAWLQAFCGIDLSADRDAWLAAIHPAQRDRFERGRREAIAARTPFDMGFPLRNAAGDYRHVRLRVVPVPDGDGVVREWLGTIADETEQARAEAALVESEARYRAMFAAAGDAVIVTDPEGSGLVLSANPAACRLFGYSEEEFRELDRAAILDLADPALARMLDERQETGIGAAEVTYRRRDGTTFVGELRSAFFADRQGARRAVAVIRDVTGRREIERALAGERDLLQAVMNGTERSHLVFLDRDFDFVRVNEAYARTCGYRPEEMIGKNHFALYPHAENEAIFRRVRDTGEPAIMHDKPFEFPDQPDRGTTYWDWTLTPVKDGAGRALGLVLSLYETTERKHAEQALRASEERTSRQNAVLAGINRVFREALACETEEQLGQACLEVAEEVTGSRFGFVGEINERTGRLDDVAISDPGWEACRIPAAAPGLRRPPMGFLIRGLYGRVLEEGRSLATNDPGAHPASVGTPPGHPALTAFLGVPLTHAGRTIGIVAVGNRPGGYGPAEVETLEALAPAIVQALLGLHARRVLRRSEARLGLLSRTASRLLGSAEPQAVVEELCRAVMDHLGCQLFVNFLVEPGRPMLRLNACVGAPAEDLRKIETLAFGQAVCGRVARDRRRMIVEDIQADPADRRTSLVRGWGIQAYCCHPLMAGERLLGTLSFGTATRPRFEPDEVELMRVVADQVATAMERVEASRALRAANERLREEDRRKSEFLAVLSHELRNPLAPIRNGLHVLHRAVPGGDQALRAMTIIDRQVDQLTRLVDDLLDVTRIGRNKVELQRERLELNELVRRTLEDHRPVLESAGLAIGFAPAPEPVFVEADWKRLAQVVGNLLQNSGKFTAPGGRVHACVEVDRAARAAVLRVTDSGVGIAPELLGRVFEPFTQADTTLDRAKGGLGLGLSLVKGLVDLHGGSVEARSEGPGRGSEFVVRLPLAPEEERAAPSAVASPPGRPRRVLVVEDNADAAESLAEVLRLIGHEVEVARDGPEGIERARAMEPEVVLCDIGLPGMDGYEVARTLRADPALAGACLVALTGYALPEDLERADQAGFDRHLAKPPSLEELEALMAALPGRPDPPGR